jgi:molybdopterin molybdotransferase
MTGAPLPDGADAVVMIERCETVGNRVRLHDERIAAGQHILRRAQEMRTGETVLHAGARMRPQELGVLAAVGRTRALMQPAVRVAVLVTGDEITEATNKPGPGQIRNSNGPMLAAQVARAGGVPCTIGIARDEPKHLRVLIAQGLGMDVLTLSGGVSAGKRDLVPGILGELGVTQLFHKIKMKPGKPLLFGITAGDASKRTLVFALPGNPVASLVCFELFVRPALRKLMALPPGPAFVQATLTKDYSYRADRPTYHPARLIRTDAAWTVEMVPWFGSPDLRGVLSANAFAQLPDGDHVHRAGSRLNVLRVESD